MYWVRFRINGHHVRRSAHTSKKSEATSFLQRLVSEYSSKARGDRERHLYEEAAERFLREASIRPKTQACYATSDRMCRPNLGGKYLDDIDRGMLGALIAVRKATGITDTTVRRDLAFLSSMCTSAITWGWLNTNPVTAFNKKVLKEVQPRTRFLSSAEYDALLAAASDRMRPAIILAVETGLRKEELFGLTILSIDLPRKEIVLNRTKSGVPRRVPISQIALKVIRDILADRNRPRGAEHLFVRPDKTRFVDFKKGFNATCQRIGIKGLRWHDLRHTFASWFVQSGGDLYHLSRILGHSTVQMTTRYGHLRTQDLHIALEKVAQKRTQDRLIERLGSSDKAE